MMAQQPKDENVGVESLSCGDESVVKDADSDNEHFLIL